MKRLLFRFDIVSTVPTLRSRRKRRYLDGTTDKCVRIGRSERIPPSSHIVIKISFGTYPTAELKEVSRSHVGIEFHIIARSLP